MTSFIHLQPQEPRRSPIHAISIKSPLCYGFCFSMSPLIKLSVALRRRPGFSCALMLRMLEQQFYGECTAGHLNAAFVWII